MCSYQLALSVAAIDNDVDNVAAALVRLCPFVSTAPDCAPEHLRPGE
jgi:hypothetical protein